jgi:hypothetical protein
VNVGHHHVTQGIEYHAMPLQRRFAVKCRGDDPDGKMTFTVSSTRVTDVQMTIVVDFELDRMEGLFEQCFDSRKSAHGVPR